MKHIIQILILSFMVLVPAGATQAAADNDFVARMMKQITSRPSVYPSTDYKQITVSPTMMQSVVEMLTSGAPIAGDFSNEDKEIVSKLLRNVKSLRIFVATENIKNYQALANKVLKDNKKIYTIFKSPKTGETGPKAHIWTRQNGNRVVEIITILDSDEGNKELRILNFTGEFNNDFINLLVQMPK